MTTDSGTALSDHDTDLLGLPDRARIEYLQEELSVAERKVENLEAALTSARKIGAAVGIVMASEKLTYEQAFAFLSLASQRGNEKLRSIAERVLLTGSVAPWPL